MATSVMVLRSGPRNITFAWVSRPVSIASSSNPCVTSGVSAATIEGQRVGLYLRVSHEDNPRFLDRPCEELVKASGERCPMKPPYNNKLMAFRACYLMLYWSLLAVALAIGAPGAVEAQGVFYAEHEPGIGLTTELAGGPGFDETLIVDLYFYARAREASDLMTEVIHPGNRSKRTRVFAVDRGTGPAGAAVERCRVVERASVCHALDPPASIRIGGCGDGARGCWGERVEIELPPVEVDWDGEFLRLILPEGAFTLKGCACRDIGGPLIVKTDEAGNPVARASPGLAVPLPAPSEVERQYLEQRPFLRFDVSPFTRDQSGGEGGFHDLSMSFDGGVYRQQARGRWLAQAKWSGDIATKAGLNFNHLSVEAGAAFNLRKGDWLPLTLGAKGQSDQGLDALDLSAEARLAYVLPFNLSLQSGDTGRRPRPWSM